MDDISKMSRLDISYYLSDGILQKVDVASMSTSLEARVPILDHRVVEFANSLPISLKLRHGRGKYLLRKVLARHIPNSYFERRKSGFSVPLSEWFRSELKEMLLDGLSSSRVKEFGLINPEAVENLVDIHLSGQLNVSPILWALLCLLNWNEQLKRL